MKDLIIEQYLKSNYGKNPKYLIISRDAYYNLLRELNPYIKFSENIQTQSRLKYLGMSVIVTDDLDVDFDIV